MKIIHDGTIIFRTQLEITDDALKMIIESFCIEYNVNKSSMPDITGELLCHMMDPKNEIEEEIEIEGKKYAFFPFFREFLTKHLDDEDIPGLSLYRYPIPCTSGHSITYLRD